MTTYQTLQTVKDAAEETPSVNRYSDRDIYQTINKNDVNYPVLCMALQSMTVRENYITYTFQLYAAERLTNGEENRPYALAHLMDMAEEYIHTLSNKEGIVEVEFDRQYNQAEFQTMDFCICIYGIINVNVENTYFVC